MNFIKFSLKTVIFLLTTAILTTQVSAKENRTHFSYEDILDFGDRVSIFVPYIVANNQNIYFASEEFPKEDDLYSVYNGICSLYGKGNAIGVSEKLYVYEQIAVVSTKGEIVNIFRDKWGTTGVETITCKKK